MADVHANLLGKIFREFSDTDFLPTDWVARQVAQLDRVDGDIDTLIGFLMCALGHTFRTVLIGYETRKLGRRGREN